jgi:CDP-diacylglycerol--glycerol-3-phosphate 3-phosphatidyltransferase
MDTTQQDTRESRRDTFKVSSSWRSVIPNLITSSRGFCGVAIFILVILMEQDQGAFYLFIGAILTDLLDGWVARKIGGTSSFGLFLDPFSDKILIDLTWLTLLLAGWAPWWLAGTMIFRDVTVALIWFISHLKGYTWKSNRVGQLMVCFEGVALPVLLWRQPLLDVNWPAVGLAIGCISLFLAAISAIICVQNGAAKATGSAKTSLLR